MKARRRPIVLGGRQGVDFSIKVKRDGAELVVNQRLFATDRRMYHLIYVARLEAVSEEEIEMFFGSFQFVE